MAFFITWSFIWDDEIVVSEGSYHFDFAEAQAYREESLKAIQNALGLGEQPDAQGTAGQNTFLRSFEILGKPLCEEYTIAQRKRFLREWVRFLDASEWEQRRRIEGTIPSLDEYLACRMGTNGAYVLLALDEFALGIQLPQEAMDHPAMQVLWEATNKILSM
ncbi:predicted protein [Aspergillus terreus NIH2624]|uniref:Uncharacterized protein n=1 Tax=Aspergillus terreus (strain NIH 2624 / FGSC A1156) TaxID=341663 RepID=Q0CX15_ASPTN|nr:uncharacterized protein ATEG_01769 [Aspergillus terreus NIH2624]EAU38526.1 predicted protein [Aspergillus terreus NIH2624]